MGCHFGKDGLGTALLGQDRRDPKEMRGQAVRTFERTLCRGKSRCREARAGSVLGVFEIQPGGPRPEWEWVGWSRQEMEFEGD